MEKKIILSLVSLLSLIFLISQISSWEYIYTIPDGMTLDQYQQSVIDANYRQFFLIGGPSGWTTATCDYYGTFYPKSCEKNCGSGYVESNCFYSPDSVSSSDCSGKSLSSCYTIAQNKYSSRFVNKQCICTKQSSDGCSGGYDVGDRKCSGDEVYKCSSSGSFDFVKSCEYGCEDGSCKDNPCQSHSEQKCSGNSVYWYDSCGTQEEEYIACGADEECREGTCVKFCTEQNVGDPFCTGNAVMQKYQKQDCSVEDTKVTDCSNSQKCQDGSCIEMTCPTCPGDEEWSACTANKITRNAYICDYSTNFQCAVQAQEEVCDCDITGDCNDDQICENHICKLLECQEGETLQNHECISPFPMYWVWIGIFLLLAIVITIFVIQKLISKK